MTHDLARRITRTPTREHKLMPALSPANQDRHPTTRNPRKVEFTIDENCLESVGKLEAQGRMPGGVNHVSAHPDVRMVPTDKGDWKVAPQWVDSPNREISSLRADKRYLFARLEEVKDERDAVNKRLVDLEAENARLVAEIDAARLERVGGIASTFYGRR